jgi:hypothetical protein
MTNFVRTSLHSKAEVITWPNMSQSTVGQPFEDFFGDRSIQVEGTFGGASITITGSNDGINYRTLTDPLGSPLVISAPDIVQILETVRYTRPEVGGGVGTNLTISMFIRRSS